MNFLIFTAGILLILSGIISIHPIPSFPLLNDISNLFINVGASILSTAIVNFLLNRRADNKLILAAIDALWNRFQVIRTEQKLKIMISNDEHGVLIQKIHNFTLSNPSNFRKYRELSMFTDQASWQNNSDIDGFISVTDPDGILTGDKLLSHIKRKGGKVYFIKKYRIPAKTPQLYEFDSKSRYRKKDRLIWTVQDFSDGFEIEIHNRTGIQNAIKIKINHHRESEIKIKQSLLADHTELIQFNIEDNILPYQGFEIMWDFENPH